MTLDCLNATLAVSPFNRSNQEYYKVRQLSLRKVYCKAHNEADVLINSFISNDCI